MLVVRLILNPGTAYRVKGCLRRELCKVNTTIIQLKHIRVLVIFVMFIHIETPPFP